MVEATEPDTLMIRLVVHDTSKITEFEEWYSSGHFPNSLSAFGAVSAERWWSLDEGEYPVHYAVYTFDSPDALNRGLADPRIAALTEGFMQKWGPYGEGSRSRIRRVEKISAPEGE
ncbi:hypothetical protein [Microbacterium sp.]|uniref:hypothetical protein n=1 Tax=Microbacterium sp. TaxID=51671 RepID=UPI0039E4147B